MKRLVHCHWPKMPQLRMRMRMHLLLLTTRKTTICHQFLLSYLSSVLLSSRPQPLTESCRIADRGERATRARIGARRARDARQSACRENQSRSDTPTRGRGRTRRQCRCTAVGRRCFQVPLMKKMPVRPMTKTTTRTRTTTRVPRMQRKRRPNLRSRQSKAHSTTTTTAAHSTARTHNLQRELPSCTHCKRQPGRAERSARRPTGARVARHRSTSRDRRLTDTTKRRRRKTTTLTIWRSLRLDVRTRRHLCPSLNQKAPRTAVYGAALYCFA